MNTIYDYEIDQIYDSQRGIGIEFFDNKGNYCKALSPKFPRIIELEIRTWIGISGEATHYYGKLYIPSLDIECIKNRKSCVYTLFSEAPEETKSITIELTCKLNEKTCITLNKKERRIYPGDKYMGKHKVGENTNKFDTKEDIINRAKEIKEKFFKGDWKLMLLQDLKLQNLE